MEQDQGKYGQTIIDNGNNQDQGRYGDNFSKENTSRSKQNNTNSNTWVCPSCETINTEEVCVVCGYSQMKRTANLNALKRVGIGIVAAIFVCGVVLFAGASNRRKYNNACNLLSQQQFEEAISLFAELGDYKDSETMRTEATFIWVENLLAKKMYNDALDTLAQMPDNEKKADCIQEVRYQKASFICQQTYANFKLAYLEFEQIPGYKDSDEQKAQLVVDWAKRIIRSDDLEDAQVFLETISDLSDNQSKKIYEFIITDDYYRSDPGHDVPGLTGTDLTRAFSINSCILDVLTGDIPHRETLKKLFSEFNPADAENFIKNNHDLFVELWDLPMVQNIINKEWNIYIWLLGNWKTENGKYIKFYQKANDTESIWSDLTLPWTQKPAGTAHWSIVDLEYIWTDKDSNELAKVYRFTFLGPDTMEVYCYVNGQTYIVQRG